jgi:hypothetical protein
MSQRRSFNRSPPRKTIRGGLSNGQTSRTSKVLAFQMKGPDATTWRDAISPPEQDVKFKVISTAVISAAAPQVIKRWNPNSAYTPETGGGSGSTPGYADWAALYGYYRVVAYNYKITIMNNEAFPVIVYVVNSNNDPTTSNNSTLASNPLSQTFALSAKGGQDRCEFTKHLRISEVVGSDAVEFDDIYASLINTSPADITWMGIGVQSIGGSNVTNGISVRLELVQYTRFYDRLLQI